MPPSINCFRLVHLLLPALLAHVAYAASVGTAHGAPFGVDSLHREQSEDARFLLLQRWADAPHTLELTGNHADTIATYIATGKLPGQVLAQQEPSLANAAIETPAEREQQADREYEARAQEILAQMKGYEAKLETARFKAESAHKRVAEQEKRLSANFAPVKNMLGGLVQQAANAASKAEVQTMLERLSRMHYKQLGTLDRSATYWLEIADREKEARRVSEARLRLHSDKFNAKVNANAAHQMQQTPEDEKDKVDEWFEKYWAQLATSEKDALQKDTPFNPDEQKEAIEMMNTYASSSRDAEDHAVSSLPRSNAFALDHGDQDAGYDAVVGANPADAKHESTKQDAPCELEIVPGSESPSPLTPEGQTTLVSATPGAIIPASL